MKTQSQMKQEWIDALRSGKYLQARDTLKGAQDESDPVGYCCLGVFCSINGKEPETHFTDEDGNLYEGDHSFYNFCKDHIPGDVKDQGIQMNDYGKTFEEIADMIEREWVLY